MLCVWFLLLTSTVYGLWVKVSRVVMGTCGQLYSREKRGII